MNTTKDSGSVKKLYLSRDDRKISGVCGGLGEYLGVDSTAIRLLWVVITILTGIIPGVLGYIVMAIITPKQPASPEESGRA